LHSNEDAQSEWKRVEKKKPKGTKPNREPGAKRQKTPGNMT